MELPDLMLFWCSMVSVLHNAQATATSERGQAQCSVTMVTDCTEGHRSTFNDLINLQSKSLLHGIDAARITHLCDTHSAAMRCLNQWSTKCPKVVEAEAKRLHNLTRLCHKITSSDLMDTYTLHQRCLQTKTRKAVDDCWIAFHGDTDGNLSPWVHTYPRNTKLLQRLSHASSETHTRKIHLAVCLLHHCLEETLRSNCDDSRTAYEKQASRLVNELVAPLPPFSIVNINCTAFREEYENYHNAPARQVMSRTSSNLPSSSSKMQSSVLSVVTMIGALIARIYV